MGYILPFTIMIALTVMLILPLAFYFVESKRLDQSRVTKNEINQILNGRRLR